MNIVYVCSLLFQKNSSAAIRNLGLINGFIENGHKVTVITVDSDDRFSNPLFDNLECTIKSYSIHSNLERGGASIVGKLINLFPFLGRVKRILTGLVYFPDTHKKFIDIVDYKVDNECNVIISSSDTKSSHYVGSKLSQNGNNVQWVQIWGDPWSSDVTLDSVLRKLVVKKEKKLLGYADKIVYVSEPTLIEYKSKFPKLASKMFFVPRSYLKVIENKGMCDLKNIRFLYTGSISNGRSITDFLFRLNKLQNSNLETFNYVFDIYGSLTKEQEIEFQEVGNVNVKGVVAFDMIQQEFMYSDVLVFIANKEGATQIPGKLFDYMGTNLPILCIVHSIYEPVSMFLKQYNKCMLVTFDQLKSGDINSKEFFKFIASRKDAEFGFSSTAIASRLEKIILENE